MHYQHQETYFISPSHYQFTKSKDNLSPYICFVYFWSLYEWNHTACTFFVSGFFCSMLSLRDSSTVLWVAVIYNFSLLYSIQLYESTICYLSIWVICSILVLNFRSLDGVIVIFRHWCLKTFINRLIMANQVYLFSTCIWSLLYVSTDVSTLWIWTHLTFIPIL